MESVERFSGKADGSVEPEGYIGLVEVVVNGLGTEINRSPFFASTLAMASEPSPPTVMSASM